MPINLSRHVKMWIHPNGLIPDKIVKRLIFQRTIRPNDSLSFFVNQCCVQKSSAKLVQLSKKGIKVKIIEVDLNEKNDDKFLVSFAKQVLARVAKTQNVCDSIFATDVLKLMKMVQREGLYSNNDVLFLNFNQDAILRKQYLFGCHAQGMPNTRIFGIDLNYCESFYQEVIEKIKDICGEPPYKDLDIVPGLTLIPDNINICAYGHLNFPETRENVITARDDSVHSEEKIYLGEEDTLLKSAEEALKKGHVTLNPSCF